MQKHYITTFLLLLFGTIAFCQESINQHWEFSKDQSKWVRINLPHTWNAQDAHDDERGMYMGDGWYKRNIFIPKTDQNQIFIKFEGANQVTEMSVNGESVGTHKGGYTAFVFDITKAVRFDQMNEFLVKVNNAIDKDIAPLSADFTFYGGIYRDVLLIRKGDSYFDLTDGSTKGIFFTQKTTVEKATLSIKSNFISSEKGKGKLLITLYDPAMQKVETIGEKVKFEAGKNSFTSELVVNQPQLWSTESPNLYTIEVKVEDAKGTITYDSYVDKTGFRWFEMEENRSFKLNGKPLKLIGVNRHQDFENLGNALPDAIHRRDIELLKEMGANFIRIAHYPQDPAFIQACDELGILVWEEIPNVNYISLNKEYADNSANMLKEMIRQHFNHPSVIMWGFMNEILLRPNKAYKVNEGLTEEKYFPIVDALHKRLDSVSRVEDPDRWVTIAHHLNKKRYEAAGLNNVADIVGWNLYPGWYGNDPKWEKAGLILDEFHGKHPDKGIIVAEYGAGADPRIHAVTPKRFDFSVEWQTLLHTNYLRQINERPHVMGGTIWNFVDFGSEGRSDAVPRINSKGVMTVDRQPKDAYLFYQAALLEKPFLKIGNTHWRKRKGFSAKNTLTHPVHIFTNEASVEVFLNEKSLGSFEVKDRQLKIDVPFVDGQNLVHVKSENLSDFAYYEVEIIPEDLKSLTPQEIDISMNVGSHVHFHHPATDAVWVPEQAYKEGGMGYLDGDQLLIWDWKVGVGNEIFGSDLEPVYQTHRDTISGFKIDVPDGVYEVTLHFAEIYAKEKREKLANNLGSDRKGVDSNVNREFLATINQGMPIVIRNLEDFMATPIKSEVFVKDGKGILIQFEAIKGTAFLSGVEVKGF